MKKVLLLEDDASLGATLSERLVKESYLVEWVRDIKSGRKAILNSNFDLAILDVGLADGSGFDLAKEIRAESLLPFIFVTAQADAEDRLKGYEIGAEEYIPKPFHLKELLLRVRHVLENHSFTPVIEMNGVKVDIDRMIVMKGKEVEKLNLKEATLLKLLIARTPKAVSRDEILDLIWGEDDFPSNRTIDNIILRLRQALGPSLGDCIESVRGLGYRWIFKEDVTNG